MRLIDADEIRATHRVRIDKQTGAWPCVLMFDISNAPTISPESLRPKGRWIVKQRHSVSDNPYMDDNYFTHVTCSACNACIQSDNRSFGYSELKTTNYCPNCGAKMEE